MVERGVVVGGVMICGSFLLAVLLNRSAMEELPAPPPAAVVSPVAPTPRSEVAPDCPDEAAPQPDVPTEPPEASDSDLMVNGSERCPR